MFGFIKYIILYSIPINFVWEMVQMPFYKNMPWDLYTALYCSAASVGDAVMILIIFYTVAFFVKDIKWIFNIKLREITLSLIIGFIISVFVEQSALSINMWDYSSLMPKIPLLDAGITPVLQMLVLPLFIFKLTKYRLTNISRSIS